MAERPTPIRRSGRIQCTHPLKAVCPPFALWQSMSLQTPVLWSKSNTRMSDSVRVMIIHLLQHLHWLRKHVYLHLIYVKYAYTFYWPEYSLSFFRVHFIDLDFAPRFFSYLTGFCAHDSPSFKASYKNGITRPLCSDHSGSEGKFRKGICVARASHVTGPHSRYDCKLIWPWVWLLCDQI